MTEEHVAVDLFSDMHVVHVKVLVFRLRCISHRLMCFGFEKFVNTYEPRELVMLSALMQGHQHNRLLIEAHALGDKALKQWIETMCPELFPVKELSHGR